MQQTGRETQAIIHDWEVCETDEEGEEQTDVELGMS